MTMSDRVAILNHGELQQIATPEQVYTRPANKFVAGFIGSPSMNFLQCSMEDGFVKTNAFSVDVPGADVPSATTLGIRPEDVLINEGNRLTEATVDVFENVGSYNIVYLDVPGLTEDLVAQVPPAQHLAPGDQVGVSLDVDRIHLFDEHGEAVRSPEVYSEQELTTQP